VTYEQQVDAVLNRLVAHLDEQLHGTVHRRQTVKDLLEAIHRLNKPLRPAAFWVPGQDAVTTTDGAEIDLRGGQAGEPWAWRVVRQGTAPSRSEARDAAERAANVRD
jgi:hypothetical protein